MNSPHDLSLARPTSGTERLEVIDALRGFALAGVLLVNLGAMSLYYFLDDGARAALPSADFDAIGRTVKAALFDRKAVTLFSLLFGLGFAIQLERADSRGAGGISIFARRIVVLGLFALLHVYLIWWGDILLIYAVLGLLMIPFRSLSNTALLWLGLLIALVLPPLLSPWISAALAGLPTKEAMYARALAGFSSESYMDVVRTNFIFGNWTYRAWWDDWFFVFGRFLLGYWAGRTLLLHDPVANGRRLQGIFRWAMAVGIVGTAVDLGRTSIDAASPVITDGTFAFLLDVVARAGPLGLGIAYGTGFALLFRWPGWRGRLALLAPLGRMALTNYLMQSVVGLALFYPIGLGIGPRYGYVSWILTWLALIGAQIVFSRWWLSRYRFGPMEWLWRSLTYGRPQPMRIASYDATREPVRESAS